MRLNEVTPADLFDRPEWVTEKVSESFLPATVTMTIPRSLWERLVKLYNDGRERNVRDCYKHGFNHFVAEVLNNATNPFDVWQEVAA